jgi:hypothetical protein
MERHNKRIELKTLEKYIEAEIKLCSDQLQTIREELRKLNED